MCVCVCVYIYIYIYIYNIYIFKLCCFFIFERQTIEVSGWCNLSMLLNFSENKAFATEISFLIPLSSVWTFDIFSLLTLKTSVFIENSLGDKHSWLANQLQIILYSSTTFLLVSQSNALIYICRKSAPSMYLILIGHPIKPPYRGLVN